MRKGAGHIQSDGSRAAGLRVFREIQLHRGERVSPASHTSSGAEALSFHVGADASSTSRRGSRCLSGVCAPVGACFLLRGLDWLEIKACLRVEEQKLVGIWMVTLN